MLLSRDSLIFGSLLTALLAVHAFDGWKPLTDVTPGPPPRLAAANGALPVDVQPRESDGDPDPPTEWAADDQIASNQQTPLTPARTGIIDSFEPYSPKMIDEAPPSPKLIDTPAPPPPKLVEIDQPPPPPVPEPEPPPVKFFETETRANSVGYVVDCSGSMAGDKFQAVCLKLAESILALKRDQEFFVVFFNNSFFPMTGSAAPKLVKADSGNKRAILKFLTSAQASGGTDPQPALRFMTAVKPGVIYLLTDGEFSPLDQATYDGFRNAGIVVHTLGFETGGRVAVLEEIARRTAGTYQPAARGAASDNLLFAPERMIREALSAPDPSLRRAAARAAVLRGLPFEIQLIDMLRDTDADLRETILDELREAAGGSEFGTATADDVDGTIKRWKSWRTLRGAGRARIVATLQGSDPDGRWVAAAVARAMKLDAPDEYIAALRVGPASALAELRAALVHCSGGEDFGPAHDATAEQIAEAADRWQAWRDAVLAREAAARRAQKVRRAADLLTQAKNLVGVNDAAVERRYQELVNDFGDTPAGEEARSLLEALNRPRP